MLSSEQILENAAQDGSIDMAEWPRVLETILQKLHDIVHNDFPIPNIPSQAPPPTVDPEVVPHTPSASYHLNDSITEEQELPDAPAEDGPAGSQSSTKENDEPADIASRRPPVPGFEVNHDHHHEVQPPQDVEMSSGGIPPDLWNLYQTTIRVLQNDFSDSPPYTIQRLAEMILQPKKHYRYLPAYLRALDRTISVSSPISDFPLPTLNASLNGSGFLTNGDANQANGTTNERDGLGSDESLGGALLTPIPWLRNTTNTSSTSLPTPEGELHSESTETIEGPNGTGSIETVSVTVNGFSSNSNTQQTSPNQPSSPTLSEQSDASTSTSGSDSTEAQLRQQGGVTQGELLRQEQEAGVIPVSQPGTRRSLIAGGAAAVGRDPLTAAPREMNSATEKEGPTAVVEDVPHARGPDEIGFEDTGAVHQSASTGGGLDLEAAVGRVKSPPAQEKSGEGMEVDEKEKVEEGDMAVGDADAGPEQKGGDAAA